MVTTMKALFLRWIFVGVWAVLIVANQQQVPRRPGRYARASREPPFTIANMTCEFFQQPLNHFDLPRNKSGFFLQRFCYYDGFIMDGKVDTAPVFLYTGNESPLEQYINHTGLMWESASQFGAQVVFIEHRYEGKSLPNPNMPNCLAYAASYQALADYANFIETYLFHRSPNNWRRRRPVIVFGGSYGGMLSAWMRMLYPHLVTGAMAASAPIGGFPSNRPTSIDAAYRVIRHGLAQAYPPTKNPSSVTNHCPNNLLAAWPLIDVLSREETGRKLLKNFFRLCNLPPSDGRVLTSWAQSPWFDMAEGSFPYPSSYITFALTHSKVQLPAWPLQAACWTHSELYKDWNISFQGDPSNVLYNITYGDSGLTIMVDWDQAIPVTPCKERCWDSLRGSESIRGIMENLRDAVSVWFNVTKDVMCYNLTSAPNRVESQSKLESREIATSERYLRIREDVPAAEECARRMEQGSWRTLL